MKILNFGSMNLDYVYLVDHIVQPGETISSVNLEVFPGGKGLNQSVALARAGSKVYHAGMIGPDGELLIQTCKDNGIDTSFVRTVEERSGNAIIQVSSTGQNSIVLFGGANQKNEKSYIDEVLSHFAKGDLILLQNEINRLDYIIEQASKIGMVIALNPSPYDKKLDSCKLENVDIFLMNEVEGEQITGEVDSEAILKAIRKIYPKTRTVLTLGKYGVIYQDGNSIYRHGIYDVPVIDTTAAGDTFTGYFISTFVDGGNPQVILQKASAASSLSVSKKGAATSIPWRKNVDEFLEKFAEQQTNK